MSANLENTLIFLILLWNQTFIIIMLKHTLTILFTGLLTFQGFSQQSETEEKLKVLYADEKYSKCANKAIKYTESKKYRKDPIPYIYASMACLRIHQNYELRLEFPKAFKDALKYAGKYGKKDPENLYYDSYISHFNELKKVVYEENENLALLYHEKDDLVKGARKSLGLIKKINDMDPKDQGFWLLRATNEIKSKNKSKAKMILRRTLPLLDSMSLDSPSSYYSKREDETFYIRAIKDMSAIEQKALRKGIMEYASYLNEKGKIEEAAKIIELGKPFFYEKNSELEVSYNSKYKEVYNEIVS